MLCIMGQNGNEGDNMKDKSKKIPKQIYLSAEEFQALKQLADDLGLSMSSYLKMLLHEKMKQMEDRKDRK